MHLAYCAYPRRTPQEKSRSGKNLKIIILRTEGEEIFDFNSVLFQIAAEIFNTLILSEENSCSRQNSMLGAHDQMLHSFNRLNNIFGERIIFDVFNRKT